MMTEFKRGLSDKFVSALRILAERGGWWAEVLQDKKLIIGIRDEYLNVYWQGQSIFKVEMKSDRVVASTHPKYLINPELSGQIAFDAYDGVFGCLPEHGLTSSWERDSTLSRMKRAAELYAGEEKKGVHAIAIASENLVDVEIALSAREQTDRCVCRLDIATFEPDGSDVRLVFWEAKTFYNRELRSDGEKSVAHQIAAYQTLLSDPRLRHRIMDSYRIVARNVVALASLAGRARSVGSLIQRVANGGRVVLSDPPDINLVVYGFDAAQRDAIWKPLKTKLASKMGASRIVAKGDPAGINLASLGES